MKHTLRLLLLAVLLMFNLTAHAVYQENIPQRLTQPDGSVLLCLASGDEYFNFLHDEAGYTIIQGNDGFYYYATRQQDDIVASPYRADSSDPSILGLEKTIGISQKQYNQRVEEFMLNVDKSVKAPITGDMTNLAVYIRFSDDTEFDTPRNVFDQSFNLSEGPSLRHYFNEVSYQQLDIESHHFPVSAMETNVSYQDNQPRGYYQPYHSVTNTIGYDPDISLNNYTNTQGRTFRQHTLLANAVAYIQSQVPGSLVLDADNDGNVDNVSFIIRGGEGQWNTLLWAHRWVLWSQTVTIHGKRVYDFTFQPETQSGIYVLCHEMFHTLGAPDLYRYSQDGFIPVGPWDLMHSGFVHMGAYMKYKYANGQWVEQIPVISEPGTYTLNPLYLQDNNAYRIISPNNSQEYFIVEYRKRQGHYETNIPGEGLIIYRINPFAGGNAQGPPDEVYVFRPGGSLTDNGNIFQAHFSSQSGRIEFHDNTDPGGFLQDGSEAGVFIANVSMAGETISFDLMPSYPGAVPPENLVASTTSEFDILLQWDMPNVDPEDVDAPQLSAYRIYRNQALIETIVDPLATGYVDQLPAEGEYEYFVRAVYVNPDAISYGTNLAQVFMPGYFSIDEETEIQVEWGSGSVNLSITSNIPEWQVYTSEPWIQLNPLNGSFDENLTVFFSQNNTFEVRTAQIALTSVATPAEELLTITQQASPSNIEDPESPVFDVFPNPVVSDQLYMRFNKALPNGSLEIFSVDGSRVINMAISAEANENIVVNTYTLSPGLYLLVVNAGEEVIRKKVVIP